MVLTTCCVILAFWVSGVWFLSLFWLWLRTGCVSICVVEFVSNGKKPKKEKKKGKSVGVLLFSRFWGFCF